MIETRFGENGDALIEAANEVSLGVLQPRFARFVKAHQAWKKAQMSVAGASASEGAHRLSKGEADALQDSLIDELATALAADGFNRINPFKGLSPSSPSRLKDLGDAAEAKAAQSLARSVSKSKQASPKSKAIATRLDKAAAQVLALVVKVATADKATTAKRTSRNALLNEWTKAYGLLKLAAKLVKNEGDPVPFDTLFPAAPKKSKPKAPPAAPAP
jgi:hypothetical protein